MLDYKLKFTMIENAILYNKDLNSNDKIVYSILNSYVNQSKECYPSLDTIAERAGISKTTVIKSIKKLEELRLINKLIRKSTEKMVVENKAKEYTIYKNQTNIYKILEIPKEMIDEKDPMQICKVEKYEPTAKQKEIQELSVYMVDKNFKINYFTKELFFDDLLEKFSLESIKKAIDKAFDRNINSPRYVEKILYKDMERKKDKEIKENNSLELYKNITDSQKSVLDLIDSMVGLKNIAQSYIKGYLKLTDKYSYEQISDALVIAKKKNVWIPSYITGIIDNKNKWNKESNNNPNFKSKSEYRSKQTQEMTQYLEEIQKQQQIKEFKENALINPNNYDSDFERHKAQHLAWLNKYDPNLPDEEKEKEAIRVAMINIKEGVPFYV